MVRFIHAADIHLDSPMRQLESYEGAPADEIRLSTREALTKLIDLAIHERVDFVLIAGDLYDGDWPDTNTGLRFASQAARLKAAGIPLYFISGNHDAASKLTKALPLQPNPDGSVMQLPSTKVASVVLEDLGVAIHGRGFRKQAETGNLAEAYPRATSDLINIGVLHTSLEGAVGHASYAPCTPQQLADKGYDYWALGHIHQRSNRAIDGSCPIVFSGNTQGRSVRECGAKGCVLVELDSHRPAKMVFHPLDVCRWNVCEIDATEIDHMDDLVATLIDRVRDIAVQSDDRTSIVRALVTGETRLHESLIARHDYWQSVMRQAMFEINEAPVYMERLRVNATAPSCQAQQVATGPVGELVEAVQQAAQQPDLVESIAETLNALCSKLPPELAEDDDGISWNDRQNVQRWIAEAKPLLMQRFGGGENEDPQSPGLDNAATMEAQA